MVFQNWGEMYWEEEYIVCLSTNPQPHKTIFPVFFLSWTFLFQRLCLVKLFLHWLFGNIKNKVSINATELQSDGSGFCFKSH